MKNKFLGSILILAGFGAAAITVWTNYQQGLRTADQTQAYINATLDGMALLACIIVGALIASKLYKWAWGAGIFALLFGICSVWNLMGYSASSKMAVSKAAQLNLIHKTKAYNDAVALRKAGLEWAVKTTTDKKVWKSRAKVAGEQVTKIATSGPVEPITVTAAEAMPDAQAMLLARFAGFEMEDAQALIAFILALALVLAKPFAGIFGTFLAFRSVEEKKSGTGRKDMQFDVPNMETDVPNMQPARNFMQPATSAKILSFPEQPDEPCELPEDLNQWFLDRTDRTTQPSIRASQAFDLFIHQTQSGLNSDQFYKAMKRLIGEDHITKLPDGRYYHMTVKEDQMPSASLDRI